MILGQGFLFDKVFMWYLSIQSHGCHIKLLREQNCYEPSFTVLALVSLLVSMNGLTLSSTIWHGNINVAMLCCANYSLLIRYAKKQEFFS